ncbi:alpha-1B adrenergic receptor isoform X2 [Euwallacea fornicatus]|uniref:alpha-1B adrenergic receptor isoform X2 n=1 Tax=Euwallacea fornicatus TaxID=995702 RepID=UPI00338DACEC
MVPVQWCRREVVLFGVHRGEAALRSSSVEQCLTLLLTRPQMDSDYHWLVTVALVTSSIIAVTANVFLLVIFARRRSLRTIPNRFVINLLVTNLLSSLLLIPLLVVDQGSFPLVQAASSSDNRTVQSFEEKMLIKEEIFRSNRPIEIIQTREQLLQTSLESSSSFAFNNRSTTEDLLCYFAQASTSFVCTASIFSILLIGVNQYFGVIHSLRYHSYVNKSRATIFILSSWLAALLCAALSTVTYSDGSLWHFCSGRKTPESSSTKVLNTVYAFMYFFLVILAPFLGICMIYVCIYAAARQNSERMRKSTSASSTTPLDSLDVEEGQGHSPSPERKHLPKVHSAPNFSVLECNGAQEEPKIDRVKRTSSDRNNFIVNLKHKISNASVFRYREETRAAKISVLVIFMVLICYVPYGLTLVLASGCIGVSPGQIFNYLSLVLLVFSNVLSPFLFGYRNKRVKREIGKMLGLVPPCPQTNAEIFKRPQISNIVRNRSFDDGININIVVDNTEPLLESGLIVPEVIVTCKPENERKSILKRVGSGWSNYKKCNFITVPDSCLGDARGSFSSASTQVSNDEF